MPNSHFGRRVAEVSFCSRKGSSGETIPLFNRMQTEGFTLNPFVLPSVLRSASNLYDSSTGRSLHGFAVRLLLASDLFITSALIDMYSKCGRVDDARCVFDQTPEKDLVIWNSMVAGYASQGLANEGERLVVKMRSCGVKPDLVTWNSLISGYAQSGNEQKAMELLDHMRSTGIQPDAFSWTSLISGSVRNFEYENAFALFRQMVSMAGIRPTSATISSLLPASSNVMNLSRGKEIHCYSVAIGVVHDLYVSSSLVDMYAKCGLLSDAEKMFDDMLLRNTVSCNSMIFAYASHGQCEKAIQLYSDMKMYCAKPDYLTFTALLTACSHSGMVEFGSELFRSMQEDYAISPRMEHYACMVDLLGRAGRLREAYSFICGMRVQPNSSVWRALLGACRLHGEAEMAYIAERCLHELKPGRRPLPFKMLRAEELGDVLKVRQLGKKRMRRYKGCSWTQAASAAKLKRSGPCTLRSKKSTHP